MKFGKLIKRTYLCIILLLTIVTVIPMIVISIQIAEDGYEFSFLNKIINEIEK